MCAKKNSMSSPFRKHTRLGFAIWSSCTWALLNPKQPTSSPHPGKLWTVVITSKALQLLTPPTHTHKFVDSVSHAARPASVRERPSFPCFIYYVCYFCAFNCLSLVMQKVSVHKKIANCFNRLSLAMQKVSVHQNKLQTVLSGLVKKSKLTTTPFCLKSFCVSWSQ